MANVEKTVGLMYVGKKPHAIDNVAGTGISWDGRGDVKAVPERAARRLLNFPDQWWVDPGYVPHGDEVDVAVRDFFASGKIPPQAVLAKAVEDMDEVELVEYAKREYGQRLDPLLSAKELRAAIEDLEAAAQAEGGAAAIVSKPRPRSQPGTEKTEAKPKATKPAKKAGAKKGAKAKGRAKSAKTTTAPSPGTGENGAG